MNIDEYRIRARRFLSGDFRCGDLDALFLLMRNKPFGCETVRDIGNMRGHANSRNQGIALDRIRDQFQMLRIAMWRFAQKDKAIDLHFAPSFMFDAMKATLASKTEDWIRSSLRMKRSQVIAAMVHLQSKFREQILVVEDDRFPKYLIGESKNPTILILKEGIIEAEIFIIKELTSQINIEGVYGRRKLVDEFTNLLVRWKLIDGAAEKLSRENCDWLSVFAVYAMHGVAYELPDGILAHSQAGVELIDGELILIVGVEVKFPFLTNQDAKFGFGLFNSELNHIDWVEKDLQTDRRSRWTVPLELNDSARLIEMKV